MNILNNSNMIIAATVLSSIIYGFIHMFFMEWSKGKRNNRLYGILNTLMLSLYFAFLFFCYGFVEDTSSITFFIGIMGMFYVIGMLIYILVEKKYRGGK